MPEPTNFILYIQLTGYCIAGILSLCITIPMSMHQDNFKVCFLILLIDLPDIGDYYRVTVFCSPPGSGGRRTASSWWTGPARPTATSPSLSGSSCSSSPPPRSTGTVCSSTRTRTAASSVLLWMLSPASLCAGMLLEILVINLGKYCLFFTA